jgi:hypothetical protein
MLLVRAADSAGDILGLCVVPLLLLHLCAGGAGSHSAAQQLLQPCGDYACIAAATKMRMLCGVGSWVHVRCSLRERSSRPSAAQCTGKHAVGKHHASVTLPLGALASNLDR